MSATAIVSVEDYLRRTEQPYCAYVDGVLYPKTMATALHALFKPFSFNFSVPKECTHWEKFMSV